MNAAVTTEDWSRWVGSTRSESQHIDPLAVTALASTLDLPRGFVAGDALPPGWQWMFFNPVVRGSELGNDGHPRRDLANSFLPPVPLPRRMWAGSRLRYIAPLAVGSLAQRESRILRIEPKEGRAGRMCFVTVEHTTSSDGITCIVEEQDIVYREAASAAVRPAPTQPDAGQPWAQCRRVQTDPAMLFRYSALTFNSHRIHYDLPYAKDVEGYDGLVVHGPLTATFLQLFASELRPDAPLFRFDFRSVSPLFVNEAFALQAREDVEGDGLSLRAVGTEGRVVMQATAVWSDV